jgi:hypothetical protein
VKPGGPLRRTRLERRTPLQPGGPLARNTPLRARRSTAAVDLDTLTEDTELELLIGQDIARPIARGRLDGRCEVRSPWCQGMGREFSHRLAAGQGGHWVAENGLWVCGHGNLDGCHGWIHQHPLDAKDNGWIVPWPADPATRRTRIHTAAYGHAWVLLDRRGGVQLAEEGEVA